MTQGWYESDGNAMHFHKCGFSLPNVANHLSNCINVLHDGKKTAMLNASAAPFAREAQDNAAANTRSATEKKKSSNASEIVEKDVAQSHNKKGDKVAKGNEWKATPTKNKKRAKKSGKKRNELEEKGFLSMSRFSRLKEMIGDDEETHEATSEAAAQDKNRKKNQMRSIEK